MPSYSHLSDAIFQTGTTTVIYLAVMATVFSIFKRSKQLTRFLSFSMYVRTSGVASSPLEVTLPSRQDGQRPGPTPGERFRGGFLLAAAKVQQNKQHNL